MQYNLFYIDLAALNNNNTYYCHTNHPSPKHDNDMT